MEVLYCGIDLHSNNGYYEIVVGSLTRSRYNLSQKLKDNRNLKVVSKIT